MISDAGYDADRRCTVVCNMGRNPVICTCSNSAARIKSKSRKPGQQKKNPEEFEKTYQRKK